MAERHVARFKGMLTARAACFSHLETHLCMHNVAAVPIGGGEPRTHRRRDVPPRFVA